jgi:hypothetical protein
MPRPKHEDYIDLIERMLGGVHVTTSTEPQAPGSKVDAERRPPVGSPTSSADDIVDTALDKPRDPE